MSIETAPFPRATRVQAIRDRSARLARGLAGLLAALAVLVLLEPFSALSIEAARTGLPHVAPRLASAAVRTVPDACFLLALWWVRAALSGVARGRLFAPTVARALHHVGLWLALGAAVRVLLEPSVQAWLGMGPGFVVAYDVAAVVLGAVGAALMLLARVIAHAGILQAELDGIF